MTKSLKQQAISGVKWNFLQQLSVQIINFGVQVMLARLLMPEMFGLVAMVVVFISIGQTLMDSGMTSSLIRTKNPSQSDYSTVFVTNLLMSSMIYGVVYLIAPYISDFYNQEILTDIVRVLALTFVIRAFVAVHVAKLDKEMNFQLQMKLQVPSVLASGAVGIYMAYAGYGVWSLVWMQVAQAVVFAVQYWIFIPWNPSLLFYKAHFLHHFKFGYKLTLSSLLDTVYRDLYRIVIGRFFSPAQVGFFNQAETMRLFPVQQISSVMDKVTYPLFSDIDSDVKLKSAYKQSMKLALFAVVPVMFGLSVGAEELFTLLFGKKWLPSVPYFQILALASIVRPLSSYNLNILKVKGRSDTFLYLEIFKKITGVIAIFMAIPFGMDVLVVSYLVISYLNTLINMIFSGRLIKYNILEQVKDCAVIFLIGAITATATYFIRLFLIGYLDSLILRLAILAMFYIAFYMVLILILERKTLTYLSGIVKAL